MHEINSLTGFAQNANFLAEIFPESHPLLYQNESSKEAFYKHLRESDCDFSKSVFIAWSLGAKIAFNAFLAGIISPRALIFLAPPYALNFSVNDRIRFEDFSALYKKSAESAYKRLAILIAHNDENSAEIRRYLSAEKKPLPISPAYWLNQLQENFPPAENNRKIPPILVLHGRNDAVISVEQVVIWQKNYPEIEAQIWENAGHALHLHDPIRLQITIKKWLENL
jgi:pimeloyl-ACP methyl ester carboxylesterase